MRRPPYLKLSFVLAAAIGFCLCAMAEVTAAADETEFAQRGTTLLRRFCFDCHGAEVQEARLNLAQFVAKADFASDFRVWRKVVKRLAEKKMPPPDAEQPKAGERQRLLDLVRAQLDRAAARAADDPGPVIIRRLTSAEYEHTIHDLTGLDLDLQNEFVSDAVGGEGFTNVGGAQFVQDSTLERYLAAAKQVAEHAVIGAGPLTFFRDPGKTGFELSAIARIQDIYRAHGFRTAAGEGGEAFGLDRYAKAFFVAWRFRHRQALGLGDTTLAALAAEVKLDARFVEYIDTLLTAGSQSFPTSRIVAQWRALPAPPADGAPAELKAAEADARSRCERINDLLQTWQNRFGQNADAKEEARVLAEDAFHVAPLQALEMNINWPSGTTAAHLTFFIESADGQQRPAAKVIWREPAVQFRVPDKRLEQPRPLQGFLERDAARRLKFGAHPGGAKIGRNDFVTDGSAPVTVRLPIPPGASSARLLVKAELDRTPGGPAEPGVIRCNIAQQEDTDQGKSVSVLLADPNSATFPAWKAGVLEFARRLPQISHREPAPSDRDPIPPPFDGSYNNAERNLFHYRIKYHRDDRFLVENMLDDATRQRLDEAWFDLLGSFEYHNAYLRFVAGKYRFDLQGRGIAQLDEEFIARLPAEPQKHVRRLRREYDAVQRAFQAGESRHVDDVLRFANRAWRRPLTEQEASGLRGFYRRLRGEASLAHRPAIRALLARVLLAPAFLYRVERPPADAEANSEKLAVALSDWELASRLSYFLWSSPPDDELRRAAAGGRLRDPDELARQARRMLQDPKARRFAAEFFGQWLGFYRFDRYRGADPQRFPEFTNELKAAMYDEAVTFFEHVVRRNRPVGEILFADYVFVNRDLAAHYGLEAADDG